MPLLLRPGVWRISGHGGEENAYPALLSSDSSSCPWHQDFGRSPDGFFLSPANAFCQRTLRKAGSHFSAFRLFIPLLFPAGNRTKPKLSGLLHRCGHHCTDGRKPCGTAFPKAAPDTNKSRHNKDKVKK